MGDKPRGPMLDGYVRVSQVRGREGDSFISPDVQRSQIEAWAKMRGATILTWHTDLDQSGAKSNRPGLLEAIHRVEAGQTGGIVVAKLDRFARSLPQALEAIQRIDRAGGEVVSVHEGIDPTTPAGKLLRGLLLLIAEWQLDIIRDNWRVARQRAVARGVHISSATPTGYMRDTDGRLQPHPDYAPVIRQLFERRARGDSWRELAKYLDDHHVEGPYGALNWRTRAVTGIISNRAYLGEAYSGEFVNPDAHEPIVDRATWEAAQAARGAPVSRGNPALLAGILRCSGCRHVMKPDRMTLRNGERVRIYRCRGEHASGKCPDRASVMGQLIEPHVERLFLERLGRVAGEADIDTAALKEAEEAVATAEIELAAFRDDERIVGALGADRFVEGLQLRAAAVDRAHAHLAEVRAATAPAAVPAADIQAMWPELDVEEKRKLLRSVIDCVFLRSVGRSNVPIADRSLVLWRGEAPDDLPRRGLKRAGIRPFVWPGDAPADARVAVAEDA